ncbi:MAG TPA: response regulator transcription factor [Solirubrobacteraceae bacterium]|nr:response regulator transcription factor [Solirubrobacteraceae bacterium]
MTVTYSRHEVMAVGDLTIQLPDGLVRVAGRALRLSVREFGVLVALARADGRIMAREQLYLEVWGKPLSKGDRSVDVYVHKLRSKLESAQPAVEYIHTHVGFGYRLSPEPSQDLHSPATAS